MTHREIDWRNISIFLFLAVISDFFKLCQISFLIMSIFSDLNLCHSYLFYIKKSAPFFTIQKYIKKPRFYYCSMEWTLHFECCFKMGDYKHFFHFISVLIYSYFSLHFLSHYLLHFILSFYFFLCLSSFILNLSKNWNDVYYFPFKCDQWVIILKFLKYVNSKFFFGRLYKNCFIRREVKSTF